MLQRYALFATLPYMRRGFYLSRMVFAAAGGFLTQISTDGVVRFMTDFHGFAADGG